MLGDMAKKHHGLLSGFWHRLRGRNDDAPVRAVVSALPILEPPRHFDPDDDEDVHAIALADGRHETNGEQLGRGTLVITNVSVNFLTSRKSWRIPWHRIEDTHVVTETGARIVRTRSGATFSFLMVASEDAATVNATVKTLLEELGA